MRETMNALACELLGAVIEKRDDGASRIERDGQSWFRVAVTAKTIMTSLGPLTYRRARYRSGASGASPVGHGETGFGETMARLRPPGRPPRRPGQARRKDRWTRVPESGILTWERS